MFSCEQIFLSGLFWVEFIYLVFLDKETRLVPSKFFFNEGFKNNFKNNGHLDSIIV